MILQFFKRPAKIIKKVFEKMFNIKRKKAEFLVVLSKKTIENIKKWLQKGYLDIVPLKRRNHEILQPSKCGK